MLVAKIGSAKDLAVLSKVSVNTISRLSNGGRAKLATIQALAEALNVDPAELLVSMAEKLALSVAEVEEALGISRWSLYNLIKSDGFPVLELGSRRVIPVDLLQQWMHKRVEEQQG